MEHSIDALLLQLGHMLGRVESLTGIIDSGRCAPPKLLPLVFNALSDLSAELNIRTYDSHSRFFWIGFFRGKADQRFCLFFQTRKQIENIAVKRQTSLRQQRGRTDEGHFFLLTKRRNALLSPGS